MSAEHTPFPPSVTEKITHAINHAKDDAHLESFGLFPWKLRDLRDTSRMFDTLLPNSSVLNTYEQVVASGAPPVAIHLMGFEFIFEEMQRHTETPVHGIAVSLGRNPEYRKLPTIKYVAKNVLSPLAWTDIQTTIEEFGYQSAGLIIWDAGAGNDSRFLTDDILVYDWLLQNAFDLLSNEGKLLVEIPRHILSLHRDAYMQWLNHVQSTHPNNIQAQVNRRAMVLTKTHQLSSLPSMARYQQSAI